MGMALSSPALAKGRDRDHDHPKPAAAMAVISGHVVGADDGQYYLPCGVQAWDPKTGATYDASIDADGAYTLALPAGRYRITADLYTGGSETWTITHRRVALAAGAARVLDFKMNATDVRQFGETSWYIEDPIYLPDEPVVVEPAPDEDPDSVTPSVKVDRGDSQYLPLGF
jgi:hypothetical protein